MENKSYWGEEVSQGSLKALISCFQKNSLEFFAFSSETTKVFRRLYRWKELDIGLHVLFQVQLNSRYSSEIISAVFITETILLEIERFNLRVRQLPNCLGTSNDYFPLNLHLHLTVNTGEQTGQLVSA